MDFYRQLPNLQFRTVKHRFRWDLHEYSQRLWFPNAFSKLRQLHIDQDCPGFSAYEFIKFCSNIKRFGHMYLNQDAQKFGCALSHFDQAHYKNLKFLDMDYVHRVNFSLDQVKYRQLISHLLILVTKLDLKLKNVAPQIFDEMEDDQQNQVASRIVSLKNLNIADLQLGPICSIQSFPNVKTVTLSLDFSIADEDFDEKIFDERDVILTRNLALVSIKKMPSMRKLKVSMIDYDADGDRSQLLARAWSIVHNIEELCLQHCPFVRDSVFIGENGELPFLHLTSEQLN